MHGPRVESAGPGAAGRSLVSALRGALAGRRDVRLAILFGSRARGRGRPNSDVDVAALGESLNPFALGAELSLALGLEVEVLDLALVPFPLLRAVLRDGIVVHEGERYAAARWRTRAILEVETDGPWFERMREAALGNGKKRAGGR